MVSITSDGKLGISNTDPGNLLHVGSASTTASSAVASFQTATGTCTMTPATSGSGITCSSDERLKDNIKPVSGNEALEKINKLQAVTYHFKKDPSKKSQLGFIAQAVQKIAPNFVRQGEDGYLQLNYDAFIPWITESIKTLSGKIADLFKLTENNTRRIASAETEVEKLKRENEELKKKDLEKEKRLKELEARLLRIESALPKK